MVLAGEIIKPLHGYIFSAYKKIVQRRSFEFRGSIMKSAIRIGLSMRVITEPSSAGEGIKRDAIAHDWALFLREVLPQICWVPLPNASGGRESVYMAESLSLQGLILTGGNDFGSEPLRDNTEFALLSWAKQWKHPVAGICRGAQMLNVFCGGAISVLGQTHLNARHKLTCHVPGIISSDTQVNSYHNYGILAHDLSHEFRPLATADEGSVEAFSHKVLPWLGLLWHPERESNPRAEDCLLFQNLFLKKECPHVTM